MMIHDAFNQMLKKWEVHSWGVLFPAENHLLKIGPEQGASRLAYARGTWELNWTHFVKYKSL